MGRTREGALKDEFKAQTGRNLGESAKQEILNQGNPSCLHNHIFYLDNGFDGQAWWCDLCERQEKMAYSPGFKIRFPANALISTPNPKYGGEDFYAFKTNAGGVVEPDLNRNEWVRRSLETKFLS